MQPSRRKTMSISFNENAGRGTLGAFAGLVLAFVADFIVFGRGDVPNAVVIGTFSAGIITGALFGGRAFDNLFRRKKSQVMINI